MPLYRFERKPKTSVVGKKLLIIEAGFKEIRVRDEAGIFRVIYLATRPEGVFVLHCFPEEDATNEQFGSGTGDEAI